MLCTHLPSEHSAFELATANSDLPDQQCRRCVKPSDPSKGTDDDDCVPIGQGDEAAFLKHGGKSTEENVRARPAVISGRAVVFEKDQENGFWDRFNNDKRLKCLAILAEAVEIRTPMVLPQPDFTIDARQLSTRCQCHRSGCYQTVMSV